MLNQPLEVTVYTRAGCPLCDEAVAKLRRHRLAPQLVDIDQRPELLAKYSKCVPVVVIEGLVRFRGEVNEVLLERLLRRGEL